MSQAELNPPTNWRRIFRRSEFFSRAKKIKDQNSHEFRLAVEKVARAKNIPFDEAKKTFLQKIEAD